MMDPRIEKLSDLLVNYSCHIQPGEKVLLSYAGPDAEDAIRQLIKDVYKAGGLPFIEHRNDTLTREIALHCTDEQLQVMCNSQLAFMKQMDAFISINATPNKSEMADVPSEQLTRYNRTMRAVQDQRVEHTKWCVLRWPTRNAAQLANMSLEGFTDYYFNVCTMDYRKMSKAMDALVAYMEKTDKVHIIGPGTDLTFSIKGMPAIKCDGGLNIPDGEVYSCPLRESMNGSITYNTPSVLDGFQFNNIHFDVKNGKIINATANDTTKINDVLNTDEGARYFGEFSFGINPYVLSPMLDTLFDEKIAGSFHLTPGNAYDDCNNGNKSAVHWDLVMIQRPEYGGGEIWLDDKLVRKDGLFVIPELECLNPENLK